MSDLRPGGVPVSFAGRDWHFLFTFRVVDELQGRYPGKSVFDVVDGSRQDTLDGLMKLIDVIDVLCDGQIPREEIPKALKVNTLTGKGSLEDVRLAISLALIQSIRGKVRMMKKSAAGQRSWRSKVHRDRYSSVPFQRAESL